MEDLPNVYIDGRHAGFLPLTTWLKEGQYWIEAQDEIYVELPTCTCAYYVFSRWNDSARINELEEKYKAIYRLKENAKIIYLSKDTAFTACYDLRLSMNYNTSVLANNQMKILITFNFTEPIDAYLYFRQIKNGEEVEKRAIAIFMNAKGNYSIYTKTPSKGLWDIIIEIQGVFGFREIRGGKLLVFQEIPKISIKTEPSIIHRGEAVDILTSFPARSWYVIIYYRPLGVVWRPLVYELVNGSTSITKWIPWSVGIYELKCQIYEAKPETFDYMTAESEIISIEVKP